jgi:hypothetical protein
MQFTPAIASAILAFSSVAVASPLAGRTNTPPQSLTAQLTLADTAVDRFALIPNDKDFVFPFGDPAKKPLKGGLGGDLVVANRKGFPALVGAGSGMAVGFLGPCGFNTPHVHPRATELQIVVKGSVVVEMVPENNVLDAKGNRRVIRNTLKEFDMTPFYQGSIHSQFNPSCKENATFVASFNSEDFGAGQVADELFALDSDTVQAAFGEAIDGKDVLKFKGKIPTTIAKGVGECLAKCGMKPNMV